MGKPEIVEVPGIKPMGPYSHAVRAGGMLYVAGQPGIVPATGAAAGPGFAAQARQAFENLKTVLEAGGSGMDLVVNTTVIVADAAEFGVVNQLFAEYFAASPPARMTMQVTIPKGLLISIGCVAVGGSRAQNLVRTCLATAIMASLGLGPPPLKLRPIMKPW
jgi:2-iminobutanoate/2-iminopropanoate deaminase